MIRDAKAAMMRIARLTRTCTPRPLVIKQKLQVTSGIRETVALRCRGLPGIDGQRISKKSYDNSVAFISQNAAASASCSWDNAREDAEVSGQHGASRWTSHVLGRCVRDVFVIW